MRELIPNELELRDLLKKKMKKGCKINEMIKETEEGTKTLSEKDLMKKRPDFSFKEPNRLIVHYWWFGLFSHQILKFKLTYLCFHCLGNH